ncbi:NADAR family protein [Clostridium weizhouense]|uniref:NADAR family protein n=1 Tax=Clostridium weizhouense TaxID=2859781 RepID=A0ABS7ATU7_9CLOT|nr:NADAR family protein [Clostridium weizhouense]MBW6411911.1 NADAR family protein [Clostridium weizhouense]
MAIYFYKTNNEYGCFSNFSKHGFELEGKYWMTSEHYFQAQKFIGTEYEKQVRMSSTPMEAANMGRDRSKPLRKDWEEVKDDIMRRAVLEKFKANSDAKEILLSTGDKEIIEKTTKDYYWGCGEDGTGENMLGKILMETRDILRNCQ